MGRRNGEFAEGRNVYSSYAKFCLITLLNFQDMYNAIKHQQILQPVPGTERASTSSLTPGSAMMRRGSQRSFNGQPDRLSNFKRGSIRGIQTLLGGQSPYGSNSSSSIVDGRISPSPSFATSIGDVCRDVLCLFVMNAHTFNRESRLAARLYSQRQHLVLPLIYLIRLSKRLKRMICEV